MPNSAPVFTVGLLVSRNDLSQIKERLKKSSCILSERSSDLKITSARERKGTDNEFAYTPAVNYPIW